MMKVYEMEKDGAVIKIVYPEKIKELEAKGWTVVGAKPPAKAKPPKPVINKPSDEE